MVAVAYSFPEHSDKVDREMTEPDWPRPVVHWELQAKDAEKARDFYAQMFNWDIKGAGRILQIGAGIGAPESITGHIRPTDRSGFVLYVQVRDLRESMNRAAELGGAIMNEPFDVPGGPTIAGIKDPEGNAIVLVQQ